MDADFYMTVIFLSRTTSCLGYGLRNSHTSLYRRLHDLTRVSLKCASNEQALILITTYATRVFNIENCPNPRHDQMLFSLRLKQENPASHGSRDVLTQFPLEPLINRRCGLFSFREFSHTSAAVSYTHLTLPTILRV